MPPPQRDASTLLHQRGLRATRPRIAVMEVLATGGHLDVEQVTAQVRERLGTVSTQAVYDVLGALSRVGLARRIEPAGSPARYEARAGDNHHHVVCRCCGRIEDVDCAVRRAPCLDPVGAPGFLIDEAEVTFWGLCPTCRARPVETGRTDPDPVETGRTDPDPVETDRADPGPGPDAVAGVGR